jgi:hypothetical protein
MYLNQILERESLLAQLVVELDVRLGDMHRLVRVAVGREAGDDVTPGAKLPGLKSHRRYWDLISASGRLTGGPTVLNTSFNLKGEPVVTGTAHPKPHVSPRGLLNPSSLCIQKACESGCPEYADLHELVAATVQGPRTDARAPAGRKPVA